MPESKTVLPDADFVIENYVDPREPLRDEGPFGDHIGYYTLPEASTSYDRMASQTQSVLTRGCLN